MTSRFSIDVAVLMLVLSTSSVAAENSGTGTNPKRVPLIDVTDLYRPHQDVGDNFDILAAYALPELDLRAVILDCTEPFRQPVAKDPGPELFPDARGPREPGFIPVLQETIRLMRAQLGGMALRAVQSTPHGAEHAAALVAGVSPRLCRSE